MEINLIRHGKTRGNLEKRYIGTTDEPLAPEGRKELLEEVWKDGVSVPLPGKVFTSTLKRAVETAGLLFPGIPSRVLSGLDECSFGAFENKNYEELSEDPAYREWIGTGGQKAPPGGESKEDFSARVFLAFEEALEEAFLSGEKSCAFVIHGGGIMALMERFGPEGAGFYHWQAGNGRGYRVTVREEDWRQGRKKFTEIRSIP